MRRRIIKAATACLCLTMCAHRVAYATDIQEVNYVIDQKIRSADVEEVLDDQYTEIHFGNNKWFYAGKDNLGYRLADQDGELNGKATTSSYWGGTANGEGDGSSAFAYILNDILHWNGNGHLIDAEDDVFTTTEKTHIQGVEVATDGTKTRGTQNLYTLSEEEVSDELKNTIRSETGSDLFTRDISAQQEYLNKSFISIAGVVIGPGGITTPDSRAEIYDTYSITYDLAGGTVENPNPTTYKGTESLTLRNPTRAGCVFLGWTGTGLTAASTSVTIPAGSDGNRLYTATWEITGYSITYTMAGGTNAASNPTSYNVTSAAILLEAPTRTGYTFTGWTGSNGTTPETSVTIPSGSTGNKSYTANWTPNTNTAYVVIHEKEQLDGSYTEAERDNLTGTSDTTVDAAVKSYTGFTAPTAGQVTIAADGSGSKTYRYTRNSYALTVNKDAGIASVSGADTYLYEAPVSVGYTLKDGYSFAGWTGDKTTASFTMPESATSVTATSSPISYAIGYTLNGGTVTGTNPTSYTIESDAITLINPTKSGFTFTGWTGTGLTSASTAVTIPTGSMGERAYEANFTRDTYTITYNLDHGTGNASNPASYNVEDDAITILAPTRAGYTFSGWTGSNGSTPQTSVTIAAGSTGAKTYTAHWTANTNTAYTVIHQQEELDGTYVTVETQNLTGTTDTTVTPDRRTYEGFTSPAGAELLIAGTGDASLTYRYSRNSYAVTVTKNNTMVTALTGAGSHKYGESVELGYTLASGYEFVSWSGDKTTATFTMPASPVAMTLNTRAITYNISYNLAGGTNAATNPSTYNVTAGFTLAQPTKTGYTFAGWTGTDLDAATTDVTVANGSIGDRSYTATWSLDTYNITYTMNGGTATNPATYNVNTETFTLTNPTKTGYTFTGWSGTGLTGSDNMSVSIAQGSTGARSYTANFRANTYVVRFNANGGTGTMADQSFTYGATEKALTANAFEKTGYTFAGWATSESGGVVYSNKQKVSNLTATDGGVFNLYAKWTANTYTVYYTGGGGTGTMTTQSHTYDQSKALTANAFTRPGYTFAQWKNADSTATYSDGQSVLNLTATKAGSATLTAQWTANTYTVVFNKNNTSATGSMSNESFTYDTAKALTANAFTCEGKVFQGWATSASGAVVYGNGVTVKNIAESGTVNLYAVWSDKNYVYSTELNTTPLLMGTSVKSADVAFMRPSAYSASSGLANYLAPTGNVKFVFFDERLSIGKVTITKDGGTYTIKYAGIPTTGPNGGTMHLGASIYQNVSSGSGAMVKQGEIKTITKSSGSTTITIDNAYLSSGYTLAIYAEEICGSGNTDYISTMITCPLGE